MTTLAPLLTIDEASQRRLFTEARSDARFSPAPVPMDAVRSAYELVKWGPTGNNSMPLRVAVAESPTARASVIANSAPGNQPRLESAPLILVAASDMNYHELVHITAPGVVGLRDKLAATPDARLANAHDNALIQVGYLIVGLRAAGLSVRPMGGFDRASVDSAFFAGSGWHAELLLAVGYPADDGDHRAGDRRPRPAWDDVARIL